MPFKLGTKTIQLDTPFTHNDIQYPANWIRLATESEKSAIGLVWEADPVRADDRFYWSGDINNPKALEDKLEVDQDGNPLYVKVLDKTDPQNPVMVDSTERLVTKGLKSNFISQVKATAGSILAQTDWMVVRAAEGVKPTDSVTLADRAAIRAWSDTTENAIKACTTVEELIAVPLSFPAETVNG